MTCQYCGAEAVLKDSKIIYGKSYGMVWVCPNYPDCDSYVGTHKNNQPLGTLANAELRTWRNMAHRSFDELWQSGKMKRNEAYKYMQEIMGMSEKEAHIAKFNIGQCKELREKISERILNERKASNV